MFGFLRSGLHGESFVHPRQFALHAAGDVVCGDGGTDVFGVLRIAGGEPIRHFDVELLQRDAVAALPLGFEVLGQIVKSFIRLIGNNHRQGLRKSSRVGDVIPIFGKEFKVRQFFRAHTDVL